jgi:hypothetical protein
MGNLTPLGRPWRRWPSLRASHDQRKHALSGNGKPDPFGPPSVEFRALAGMVSLVLKEAGTGGHYCDIAQYTGRDLTRYFRSEEPFYSKPISRRLWASILGS